MRQIEGTALLVTVAEDLSNEPVLKVWALDTERKGGGPRCLSTVTVQNARRQFPVGVIDLFFVGTKEGENADRVCVA